MRQAVLVSAMTVALGIVGAAFTSNLAVAVCWITVATVLRERHRRVVGCPKPRFAPEARPPADCAGPANGEVG